MRQYEDVIDAIQTGREPAVTVEHATHTLALVHSVYLSQTLGAPVKFADVLAGKYDDISFTTGADAALKEASA
jgi:UDP-N-acetyl-2-amino-2-deoxyglucuronate dehydrogenase